MYLNGKNVTFTDRSTGSVDSYLRSISKTKPLSIEEEQRLGRSIRQGCQKAREQLIKANLRFVVSVAKKYLASHASLEDLIQAGNEGLIKAVDKYDASLGFRFISFATWYVHNEVRKTAYGHMDHHHHSLDVPLDADDVNGTTSADLLMSSPVHSPDWELRYSDALENLKTHVDKRLYGCGALVDDLYHMLQRGETAADFARKHHLSERQMNRFLTTLREEAFFCPSHPWLVLDRKPFGLFQLEMT